MECKESSKLKVQSSKFKVIMDYIFKEWQEKLSKYESSIQQELAELRKCKAEVQQMRLEAVGKRKGRYIFDDERLILSAP